VTSTVRSPYLDDTKPRCGAQRQYMDEPCRQLAGWGTTHRGEGPCREHDDEHRIIGSRAEVQRQLDYLRRHPEVEHPFVHLVQQIATSAYLVERYADKLQRIIAEYGEDALVTASGRNRVAWVKMYDDERDRLAKLVETFCRLGLDDRRVRVAERQSDAVVSVIRSALAELGLSPDQQRQATAVMRRMFGELAQHERAGLPATSESAESAESAGSNLFEEVNPRVRVVN
jgi:hypothetical protein